MLLLQRCVRMHKFEGSECGQLRSVEVHFQGPGSALPWMTVEVRYAVDQDLVGQIIIANDEVLWQRANPAYLYEFERIDKFLRTGLFRLRFREGGLVQLFKGLGQAAVLIPVAIPVLAAAIVAAPIRALAQARQARSVFVPTRRPDQLPPAWIGVPVGYWNVLLPDLASKQGEVESQLKDALEKRAGADIKCHAQEIIQWGGFHLKEVRRQTILELRRAKVYLSVFAYGNDLYVRWAGHISRQTWFLQKFAYHHGVGYRFSKNFFSWAVPLFTEVPQIFEFAAATTPATDYDWADVDAAQDLAHEVLTGLVRQVKERYQIAKEIDFAMKTGERTEHAPATADADSQKRKPTGWGRGLFARQQ